MLYLARGRVAFRAFGAGVRFDVSQSEVTGLRYSRWIGPSFLCSVEGKRYRIGFHEVAGLRYPENLGAPGADPLIKALAFSGSGEELCRAWLELLSSGSR